MRFSCLQININSGAPACSTMTNKRSFMFWKVVIVVVIALSYTQADVGHIHMQWTKQVKITHRYIVYLFCWQPNCKFQYAGLSQKHYRPQKNQCSGSCRIYLLITSIHINNGAPAALKQKLFKDLILSFFSFWCRYIGWDPFLEEF